MKKTNLQTDKKTQQQKPPGKKTALSVNLSFQSIFSPQGIFFLVFFPMG